ncbi:MAG: hypothetical protein O7F73_12725 [Gammaproteobacteria bacterium]|nr:hypothetical protein [Gammaproteobacteria bacterium]
MGLSSIGGAVVGAYLVDSPRPMTVMIVMVSCASYRLIKGLQRR